MFNGTKLKELEQRVEQLETGLGGSYAVMPGENYISIRSQDVPRVSVREAVRKLYIHLGLEFKRTPETLQVVKTAKK